MPAAAAQAYDLNYTRVREERPEQNLPFIYDNEFHGCVRMAFVRDLQINIREGTKDLGPTNLERVRILSWLVGPRSLVPSLMLICRSRTKAIRTHRLNSLS